MIIKSLSRATKSFEALYNYLTRDKESLLGAYNLYSNAYNKKELVNEFLENAKYLKKSRGKNYLYHEIISLNQNNLPIDKQRNILIDLVNKYISLRAKNHLVFSALHFDKKHLHIHLMISANELLGNKRVRLSKKDFSLIQQSLEEYKNSTYPELGGKKLYNKNKDKLKSKKEQIKETLENLFNSSYSNKEEFEKNIKKLNLEFYTRGKTIGVIFENKKYRLKTLGYLEKYQEILEKFEKDLEKEKVALNENEAKIEKRREELKAIREKQKSNQKSKQR